MLARFLTRLLALPLLAVTLHAQADGLPPAVLQALKAAQIGSKPFPVEIDFSTYMTCGGTTARH